MACEYEEVTTFVNDAEHYQENDCEETLPNGDLSQSIPDISELCRLCDTKQDPYGMLAIFSDESNSLEAKIANIIRIEVYKGDGLPSALCVACVEKLDAAHNFIQTAIAWDSHLRLSFTQIKSEFSSQIFEGDSNHSCGEHSNDGFNEDPLSADFEAHEPIQEESWHHLVVKMEMDPLLLASGPSSSGVKRKRGRPRSDKPRKPVVTGPKRGRGRPRKNPSIEPKVPVVRSYELIEFDDDSEVASGREDKSDGEWAPEPKERPAESERLAEGGDGRAETEGAAFDTNSSTEGDDGFDEFGFPAKAKKARPFTVKEKPTGSTKPIDNACLCPICGKHFANKAYVVGHLRTHTGERPHACETCGRAFADRSSLRQHRATHDSVRPFACDECDKSFKRRRSLKTHLIRHQGVKALSCDVCGRGFALKEGLRTHMNVHGQREPFSCSVCAKDFRKKWRLRKHAKIHKANELFQCQLCQRVFSTADQLYEHTQLGHTNPRKFPCDTCDKAFTDRSTLTVHKRIHTGERPFVCADCGKSYAKSSTYHVHRRTHTGERPYACVDCDATFATSTARNKHAKKCAPAATAATALP